MADTCCAACHDEDEPLTRCSSCNDLFCNTCLTVDGICYDCDANEDDDLSLDDEEDEEDDPPTGDAFTEPEDD